MKELFEILSHVKINSPSAFQIDYLVDTCFFYFIMDQHESRFVEFCSKHSVGITSFNVEELVFHSHDVHPYTRKRIRSAIKGGLFMTVVDIDVHPGNPFAEKEFIQELDAPLLNIIPDPSDGVLAAVATSIHADVLTRDKHHLFTSKLENYFFESGLKVLNNLP